MNSSLHFFYLIVGVVAVSGRNCDEDGILIYEDLGCTPEYGDDKECPVKYSCKGLEPSNNECFFRGKSYANGESVNNSLSESSCDIGCFCSGGSRFTCAILDCPEWLGVVKLKPGCYREYAMDSCCSVGQICPPFDNIEKCTVETKEYSEGEKFSPSNTCLNCVCQKGFTGKFEEPFCKRQVCGQQLRRSAASIAQSCAPFYRNYNDEKVHCCPYDWICPDGSETIQGEAKSEETCKFGKTAVKVGQYLEKTNVEHSVGRKSTKVKCECVIPPFMKCIDV